MFYVYTLLGILLRSQVFEVNNGNDDWMDLVHPEKYGLTQTQNFYMQVFSKNPIYTLNYCILRMIVNKNHLRQTLIFIFVPA